MAPIKKYYGKKITRAMWKSKVAAWRESTTTFPSGRHLSHFKALIRRFADAEDPNTDEGKIILFTVSWPSLARACCNSRTGGTSQSRTIWQMEGIRCKNALAD
eukprot:4152624-Ditylum_brightwellii.AAC.1